MENKKKLNKPVLAEGEVTGHAHRLSDGVDVFQMDNGTREFCLEKEDNLKHEEHKEITLNKGEWVSGIVVEFDHFKEEAREVQD